MNKNKVGLAVGVFAGFMHLVWGVFVAFGFAQSFLDFIYTLHSITPSPTVMPFDLSSTVGLIVFASMMGYIVGYIFATFWHKVHR